jgi:hypothetical protein
MPQSGKKNIGSMVPVVGLILGLVKKIRKDFPKKFKDFLNFQEMIFWEPY